jgi:hypothetical protein
MTPAGFEAAISEGERLKTHALDRAAIGPAACILRYSDIPCHFAASSYIQHPTVHTQTQ